MAKTTQHFLTVALAVALSALMSAGVTHPVVDGPSVWLNRTAAERFVNLTESLDVPTVGRARFFCEGCTVFYHPSYFTAYMALDDERSPRLVASVHACFDAARSSYAPCAVERRNFPVSSHVLHAIDVAIAAFGEPLFHNRSGGDVPGSTNASSATAARHNGIAVDELHADVDDTSPDVDEL